MRLSLSKHVLEQRGPERHLSNAILFDHFREAVKHWKRGDGKTKVYQAKFGCIKLIWGGWVFIADKKDKLDFDGKPYKSLELVTFYAAPGWNGPKGIRKELFDTATKSIKVTTPQGDLTRE